MDKEKFNTAIIIVLYKPSLEDIQYIYNTSSFLSGIIVDNSPSRTFTEPKINNLTYKWLGENKGIAYAQNYGINEILQNGSYTHIVFLDQDSRISNTYVAEISKEYIKLSHLKKLAIIGPIVINEDNQKEYKSTIKNYKKEENGLIIKDNIISSGSCVSCSCLKEIGPFKNSLFIDYVDSEWCWRAKKHGFLCAQTLKFKMTHHIGYKTIKIGFMQDIISAPIRYYYQYRNYIWLAKYAYVPRYWKITNGIRLFCRFFYIVFYSSSPFACYKNISKGIIHGLKYKNYDK